MGQLAASQGPHFSQRTREMGHPAGVAEHSSGAKARSEGCPDGTTEEVAEKLHVPRKNDHEG